MSHRIGSVSKSRTAARINSKLDKHLTAYVAMAGAAGIGMMAVSQPAEAGVVYTQVNTTIGLGAPVALDLNNDGLAEFVFRFGGPQEHSNMLLVDAAVTGNAIRRVKTGAGAAAAFFGVPIGPGQVFVSNSGYSGGVLMARAFQYGGSQTFSGPWANATNRYLGLKFVINGKTHYGWARLSVGNFLAAQPVVLTGYAYETTPDTKIVSGHVNGPQAASLTTLPSTPASLGMLARGADGIAVWRREEDIAT